MTSWRIRALAVVTLLMTAGAARSTAEAQGQTPPRPPVDSAAVADSITRARILARTDSVRQAILADSIKSPLTRYEAPRLESEERLRFTGRDILSTGAVNLADLLDRVPGVSTFRSGWMAGLHVATYQGDARRIRLFIDGLEVDAIDVRNGGAVDLTDIQLWAYDEIVIERAPSEVRVWMRTASVVKTTPFTRVDIFTGDLNTNGFRGLFARRWRNGLMLQLGGQQVATQTGRVSAFGAPTGQATQLRSDGSVQSFSGRFGWARNKWSVDAYGSNVARERDSHTPREDFDSLPSYKGQRREGYLRVGYGDTLRGFWAQAVSGALRVRMQGDSGATSEQSGDGSVGGGSDADSTDTDTTVVSLDTLRSQTQHMLAVGYRGSWWNASYTHRARPIDGSLRHAPALRAGASWRIFDASAYAERNGRDSTDRTDLRLRARPFSWLQLSAAHSTRTPDDSTLRPQSSASRAEGAVRLGQFWLGGGLVREDATQFDNLVLVGAPARVLANAASTGVLVNARGRLYKDLRLDVQTIRWDKAQFTTPQTHVRVELALISDWLSRFPKGEFSVNTRLIYDRRGGVPFFYGEGDEGIDLRITEPAQVVTGMLELRIQRAVLFYQYRNLTGGQYEQIRGITMPSAVQMYGVRWEFWN
ncbi:MAG: TonB-dependent receptor plug domain-containing protein [Gemmatimonadaceae bacterium]|nr:TonB-dependent receptor plug domain-containing protein [Gemmatimonadaceae bacterium]